MCGEERSHTMTHQQLTEQIDQRICIEILKSRRAVQHLQADRELAEGDSVEIEIEGERHPVSVERRHVVAVQVFTECYPFQFDPACPISFRVQPQG
jgi:hypothetical protein